MGDVMTLMVPAAAAKGLDLQVAVAPALSGTLRGDFNKLRQILLNLVSNAVKFTESGAIQVVAEQDGSWVSFSVWDSGIGISESGQTHLFSAFAQADPSVSRRFGGTGLGLAICRKLVTALGGDIGFESQVNVGSRFWFRVPSTPSQSCDQIPLDHADARHLFLNVLVVEDNEINRVVACGLLEKSGHRVCAVNSGNQALAMLEHHRFDLILMDLNLPGLSGLETIRRIRAHQDVSLASIPVVVVSALVTKHDIQDSMTAGAQAFLGKPYRPERLEATLRAVLRPDDDGGASITGQSALSDATDQSGSEVDATVLEHHAMELGMDMANQIVELFVNTVPATLMQARREAALGNMTRVVRAAHRIKSSASTIGMRSFATLAAALELAGLAKNEARVVLALGVLEQHLPAAMEKLRSVWDQVQRRRTNPNSSLTSDAHP
jgi:two-component system sensor histidine kinase TorS